MDIKELITGTFEDYWARLDRALEGLTSEELAWPPQATCNPISFIVWHMTRMEDRWLHYFVTGLADVWERNGWFTQFGLDASDHGVRFTLEELAAFPVVSPELLLGYLDDVKHDTRVFLQGLQPTDLDIVPGRVPFAPNIPGGSDTWSVGRMFRQLLAELNQHLGQVSYLRGMVKGFNS